MARAPGPPGWRHGPGRQGPPGWRHGPGPPSVWLGMARPLTAVADRSGRATPAPRPMADCAAMSDAQPAPALRANEYRDTWCGQVLGDRVDSDARLAGWVHRRRDHGGLVFIDLRDRTGLVQLVFHPEDSGDAFELSHRLRPEDVLTVAGPIVRRDPETVNPELPTGEFELRVRDATLICALPDAAVRDRELLRRGGRGDAPALSLPRPAPRAHGAGDRHAPRGDAAIRDFLDGEGFLDIETPMLSRSTPEGARDFLVPARREPGTFYALPQSPQLFKQLLMVAGFERYFQIVRCFRDEDQRADRQPDFTQLDVEMSFVGVEDVLDLNERLLAAVFEAVGGPAAEAAAAADRLRRRDRALRLRPARPALRARARRPHRPAGRDGVQGLPRGDRGRRDRQGRERRARDVAALGARRLHRPRPGARRQGARLGVSRGRRVALADRQVPDGRRARGASTSASGPRRATCC